MDTLLILLGGAVGAGIYVGLVMLAVWKLWHLLVR
jgi:hypothetical protein